MSSPSNYSETLPFCFILLYIIPLKSLALTSTIQVMSEALSHSSHGSPGSLGPDDSISQVLPPYYAEDYRLDTDLENESSTQSDSLSSAPSGLLTTTFASNSLDDNIRAGETSATITGDISGMHLSVPQRFLPKRKARKGHCWLASNGTEVLEKGKWHWRCARCRFLQSSIIFF